MSLTPLVLTDCRIYVATADLTGYSNKVQLSAKAADLDKTTFASLGWHERVAGLFDGSADIEGFFQAGDLTQPDDVLFGNLGTATVPVTAIPTDGSVNTRAYLTRGLDMSYQLGAKVGELLSWSSSIATNWPIVQGRVLHPQGTARTTTAAGTAVQLGAVDASHALYVNYHVLSISGTSTPTLTVKVQSDDNSGFTSATDVGTFTASTALDAQTMKIAGAITDNYFRVSWTISGSTPSFLFAVSAGIGPK